MPRYSRFPTAIEKCQSLSTAELRKAGCFDQPSRKDFLFTQWRGEKRTRFLMDINLTAESPHIIIKYFAFTIANPLMDVQDKIPIETHLIESSKGIRYYFLCPETNQRCQKLYLPPNELYYRHRSFYNLVYQKQMESKRERSKMSKEDLENEFYELVGTISVPKPKKMSKKFMSGRILKIQRFIKVCEKLDLF